LNKIIPNELPISNGERKRSCFVNLKRAKLSLFMMDGHEPRLRAETHAYLNLFSKGGHPGVQARITE